MDGAERSRGCPNLARRARVATSTGGFELRLLDLCWGHLERGMVAQARVAKVTLSCYSNRPTSINLTPAQQSISKSDTVTILSLYLL